MNNVLITGGTDGIGRAVALDSLRKGHSVLVIGNTPEKGNDFLARAADLGAADRAAFLRADLRLVAENGRVLDEVRSRLDRLDRLVLCAQHYRTRPVRTAEGVEENFALSYLSRFVLSHGLLDLLRASDDPVVMNVCGTGTPIGSINWDDLAFERTRGGFKALMQASRASDLLGVAFAERAEGVRCVLYNPDFVRTNLQRGLPQPWKALAVTLVTVLGTSLEKGVVPLLHRLENPPPEPLSAFRAHKRVDLASRAFARCYDPADARRLHLATTAVLRDLGRADLSPDR
ncbi:SDR family NAD(P)-dependent oxidoreductase [Umezawaea sp.]|uniref:SDR family NAD(P)-dependent oxidoreductase n=1 Tax=Umezawaea sp. TaxID=1955258 RepID=UPI002ED4C937